MPSYNQESISDPNTLAAQLKNLVDTALPLPNDQPVVSPEQTQPNFSQLNIKQSSGEPLATPTQPPPSYQQPSIQPTINISPSIPIQNVPETISPPLPNQPEQPTPLPPTSLEPTSDLLETTPQETAKPEEVSIAEIEKSLQQKSIPPSSPGDLFDTKIPQEDSVDIISILSMAVEKQASDVYLKADTPAMARVMGDLVQLTEYKLSSFGIEKLANSLMNDRQSIKFAEDLSVDMSFAAKGIGRFRVSIYRQRGSVAMVLRRIKTEVPTIEDLHLPPVLKTIALQKRGLVLVTGATGSGKTSTLSAMLHYRSQNVPGHIITIEDPIEFILPDQKSIVSQREIDIDTLSWEKALKDAMREAPDVVLIGELRDLFAAKTALILAETGHLVLSTLHSTDTIQTLQRLIAIFPQEQHPELYLRLSMSLVSVVCQRLLRTKDGKDRYPAMEVLLSTPRIRDLIRKGTINVLKETIAAGRSEGMQTFDQHLLELWKNNSITQDDALLYSDSPNNLRLMMKGISYSEVS